MAALRLAGSTVLLPPLAAAPRVLWPKRRSNRPMDLHARKIMRAEGESARCMTATRGAGCTAGVLCHAPVLWPMSAATPGDSFDDKEYIIFQARSGLCSSHARNGSSERNLLHQAKPGPRPFSACSYTPCVAFKGAYAPPWRRLTRGSQGAGLSVPHRTTAL